MSQNLISPSLTGADHDEIDTAIGVLETKLAGLISLSAAERRSLSKALRRDMAARFSRKASGAKPSADDN